jgi:hypothetical protein
VSVLLSRARDGHCRWPVCEPVEPRRGEPRDIFGGRRICGAAASLPTSYCAEHRLRVYDRAPEIRIGSDFMSRRAPPALDQQPELTEIFG